MDHAFCLRIIGQTISPKDFLLCSKGVMVLHSTFKAVIHFESVFHKMCMVHLYPPMSRAPAPLVEDCPSCTMPPPPLQAFPSSKESHLPMFMPPSWEQPTYNERRIRGLGGYESLAPCLNSGQLWRLTPAPELPCGMGWGLSCKFVTCQLLLLSHLASLTPLERLFPRAVPSKPPTGKSHHSVCFPEALPQHTFWHELNHRYSK